MTAVVNSLRFRLCGMAGAFLHLAVLLPSVRAQDPVPLPPQEQTNGSRTLAGLDVPRTVSRPSVVQILDVHGSTLQLGVVVSEDGYLVSKASELPASDDDVTVAWADGTQCVATVVLVDRSLDLVLLKAERDDTTPVRWQPASPARQGEWMLAFTRSTEKDKMLSLRLGTLSANRRAVQGRGAALGIEMSQDSDESGVRIVDVGSASPAEVAGIKSNDLLLAVDDEPVRGVKSVEQTISRCQPGQQVKLRIRRGAHERECNVKLASRSKVVSNWEGEDYANGGVSLRTDNFPDVLQHQLPLTPHDMGGPLINLNGIAVGINIARVDRVTTFALPMESFWSKVQQWIQRDRQAVAAHGVEEIRPAVAQ